MTGSRGGSDAEGWWTQRKGEGRLLRLRKYGRWSLKSQRQETGAGRVPRRCHTKGPNTQGRFRSCDTRRGCRCPLLLEAQDYKGQVLG
jgi:hypothetical protein